MSKDLRAALGVPQALVERAIAVIGASGVQDEEIERSILSLAREPLLARRLIDWIPEAFGLVLIPHVVRVTMPKTFSARSRKGVWMTFELQQEPIFPIAIRLGVEMYHATPSETFGNIALRSAVMATVNKALNQGVSLDGATLSGPALVGIPAELYLPKPPSLWQRISRSFGRGNG